MKMLGAAFAILALAASAEAAHAQATLPGVPHYELPLPPNYSEQPRDKRDFNQNQTDYRGTEAVPFVIKELARERSQEEKAETEQKAALDRKLTEYTGDLAFYTRGLFIATLLLATITGGLVIAAFLQMRDSRKSIAAAETAAKAAERNAATSEKALVELEAPFLYIRITTPGLKVEIAGDSVKIDFGVARFTFGNYGRTPARIASYFETVVVTDAGVMPKRLMHERPVRLNVVYKTGTPR